MKRRLLLFGTLILSIFSATSGFPQGTVAFSNIPDPLPLDVEAQPYDICYELGDLIKLGSGNNGFAESATILMSTWAIRSDYPQYSDPAGYWHDITLSIYVDEAAALSGSALKTIKRPFLIPWRPEPNSACKGINKPWMSQAGGCYNGYAFKSRFDLKDLKFKFPDQFIFGISFNTERSGYQPLYVAGPYNKLRVGLANAYGQAIPPSEGEDIDPDIVFVYYSNPQFYTRSIEQILDEPELGLQPDIGWTGYPIAVQFTTSPNIESPATIADCKNGQWKNLARPDALQFKNQGDCVSFVNSPR